MSLTLKTTLKNCILVFNYFSFQNSLNQEMILVNNENIEDNKEKIEILETKEKEAIENLQFEVLSGLNRNCNCNKFLIIYNIIIYSIFNFSFNRYRTLCRFKGHANSSARKMRRGAERKFNVLEGIHSLVANFFFQSCIG